MVVLFALSCGRKQSHPPVGGILTEKDLSISKNRAKSLNEMERAQISDWIASQDMKFYPMQMNYWINVPNLNSQPRKKDGQEVSFLYEIYDFDQTKLYEKPIVYQDAALGKFEVIKALDDAIRYLPQNSQATLLIPSVLAFGTYGDNDKISHDMPIIVKLKML